MRKIVQKEAAGAPPPPIDDLEGEVEAPPHDAKRTVGGPEIAQPKFSEMVPRTSVAPKRYEVSKGGKVMYGGYLSHLKEGKVVDDVAYDVALLRSQGIVLKELG